MEERRKKSFFMVFVLYFLCVCVFSFFSSIPSCMRAQNECIFTHSINIPQQVMYIYIKRFSPCPDLNRSLAAYAAFEFIERTH